METPTTHTESQASSPAWRNVYGMEDGILVDRLIELSQKVARPHPSAWTAWKYAEATEEVMRRLGTIDKLLNHCPECECSKCAEIVCPFGEPLHLHHDGCPACVIYEQKANQGAERNAQ